MKLGMTAIAFSQQLQDSIAVAGIVTEVPGGKRRADEALRRRLARSQEYATAHPDECAFWSVPARRQRRYRSLATTHSVQRTDIDFGKTT